MLTEKISIIDNIQLLTIGALDMMWCWPENTNIDRGEAEVNIGILWLTSHHVQCLNSQQLFYHIICWRGEEDEEVKKTMYRKIII